MSSVNSDLLIRPATPADVAQIHRLQAGWEHEQITYGFVADDANAIEQKLGPYFLVAEVNGQIVGFVSGTVGMSDGLAVIPAGEPYFEIADLYVDPDMRGRQIGGQLVERVLEVARQNGLKKALVYSATKDIRRVLRFYEEHGFKSWFIQMYRDLGVETV